jgi:hypothetical protein
LDNLTQHQPIYNSVSPPTSPQKGGTPLPRASSEITPSHTPTSSGSHPSLLSALSATTTTDSEKRELTDKEREKALYPSRILLTSTPTSCNAVFRSADLVRPAYPDQHGIKPYPLVWGAADAETRGPVICSRLNTTIKQRNAIGAHSGSYSIYRALAIAMGTLNPTHKPDYSKTEPAVPIPPQPSWSDPSKIVSFDPWGHLVPQVFRRELEELGLDVRPSIAVTRAHMKLSEIDEATRRGDLQIDGRILLKSLPLHNADGSESTADPGVEIAISKAAVEPVWFLPGIAERFGM